jgi:exosome complex component RRP42
MNYDEKKNFERMLDQGIRSDGRKFDEYRKVIIETGISSTAEGSAQVSIGDTIVIAGVKIELGTPYPDTPDEGALMVDVELSPIANNSFESGPPSINAIELARVTDRGIRESRCFDAKSLCITPGEKVWSISVDMTVLNDDGNLFDACSLAALAAIRDTKFPELVDGVADYSKKSDKGIEFSKMPLGVTVIKIGKHLIVDPTLTEYSGLDARLTVCSVDDGTLVAMQKGGIVSLTASEVKEMVDLAVEKGKELRKLI